MSVHTAYRVRHFRSVDPADPAAPRELAWASGVRPGEGVGIRQGSPDEAELIRAQTPLLNALADEGEQLMLQHTFQGQAVPASYYLRLYNDTPLDTDTLATLVSEVTGTGYAAQTLAPNATDFPTLALDSGDFQVTSATRQFSAGGNWTAATQLVLATSTHATTSGLFVAWAPLSTTRTLVDGDTLDVTLAVKQS